MKILILANNDRGLYHFRKELIAQLAIEGHNIVASFPFGGYEEKIAALGCGIINIHLERRGANIISDFKLLLKYYGVIKKVNPDIVLTYTIKPNIYGGIACRWLKKPCLPNITGLGTALENEGILQKITTLLYKYAAKSYRCVFFQNEENMEFFRKKNIKAKNFKLIPGSGVNLERFVPLPYPNDETIEFAFIARIMKAKGIDQYLSVAEYIKAKYPNTKFNVCGYCEEEYNDVLEDYQQRGLIEYHGRIDNIALIYAKVHCVIHPTYYPEGLSNVLLESCASARPIITTDRSGCREVVEDGINGYVVKQKDSKDLQEKVEKFINLDYQQKVQMGLKGREKVEKEFDRNIVISAYKHTLEEL